jgi:hypothetical protein
MPGYGREEIDKLLEQFEIPDGNRKIDEEAMKHTANECPCCGFRW